MASSYKNVIKSILASAGLSKSKIDGLTNSSITIKRLEKAGLSSKTATTIMKRITVAEVQNSISNSRIDLATGKKKVKYTPVPASEYISTKVGRANDKKLRHDLNMIYDSEASYMTHFDRLYSIYPQREFDNAYQYIFMVRPDCNIIKSGTEATLTYPSKEDISNGVTSSSSCHEDQLMRYMDMHHNYMLRHLTAELTDNNDFMPYPVGRTESMQVPDLSIKNYYLTQPLSGLSIPYAGNALESMCGAGGTFQMTFRDDNELRLHKLFHTWVYYIDAIVRNKFSPLAKHIRQNKIDYATSVYCITCKADGKSIIYWSKYTVAFPITAPNSDISFNLRGAINTKLSVPFAYFLAEAMNPLILVDFNKNAHVTGTATSMKARLKDSIPIYSSSKIEDYNFSINGKKKSILSDNAVLGTGYGLTGCPFIYKDAINGKYCLGWKNPYN
jgi:hypothetical protein